MKDSSLDNSPFRAVTSRKPDPAELQAIAAGDHSQPHDLLGAHPGELDGTPGVVVRAYHPDAVAVECLIDGREDAIMERHGPGGVFGAFLAGVPSPLPYRLRFHFSDGSTWEREDPYRFLPTLGDTDLYLLFHFSFSADTSELPCVHLSTTQRLHCDSPQPVVMRAK